MRTETIDNKLNVYGQPQEIAALKNHDWFYAFSDDSNVYRAGAQRERRLIAQFGDEAMISIYGAMQRREFGEFITEGSTSTNEEKKMENTKSDKQLVRERQDKLNRVFGRKTQVQLLNILADRFGLDLKVRADLHDKLVAKTLVITVNTNNHGVAGLKIVGQPNTVKSLAERFWGTQVRIINVVPMGEKLRLNVTF
jgi:hypothetical protein